MSRNSTSNRERHGHHLAFGDDTDELDDQPVGTRLTRPRGLGAPDVTAEDTTARAADPNVDAEEER